MVKIGKRLVEVGEYGDGIRMEKQKFCAKNHCPQIRAGYIETRLNICSYSSFQRGRYA